MRNELNVANVRDDLGPGTGMREVAKGQSIAHAALLTTFLTLVNRAGGFLLSLLIAIKFGAHARVDAYMTAATIPLVCNAILSYTFPFAFIPLYSSETGAGAGPGQSFFARSIFRFTFAISGLGVLACLLLAPRIVAALAPGFTPENQNLTGQLLRLLSPIILFSGLIWHLSSVFYAKKHFTSPVLASSCYTLISLGGSALLVEKWEIFAVAASVTAGFLAQLACLFFFVWSDATQFVNLDGWRTFWRDVREFVKLMIPVLVYVLTFSFNSLLDRFLGSTFSSGSIAALVYADRIKELPFALVALSLSLATFPYLVSHSEKADFSRLRETLLTSARMLLFLLCPATVFLLLLRKPIIALLYRHGAFDSVALEMTAQALLFYLLGIVPAGLSLMAFRGLIALRKLSPIFVIAGLHVALLVGADLLLIRILGFAGLALGTSVVALVDAFLACLWLSRTLTPRMTLDKNAAVFLAKIITATLVLGVAVYWIRPLWPGRLQTMINLPLNIGFAGLVSIGLYGGLLYWLRLEEVTRILTVVEKGRMMLRLPGKKIW